MRHSLVDNIVFPPLMRIIDCDGVGEDVASTKKVSTLAGVEFSRLQDSRYGEDYKAALDTVSLELSSEVKSGGPDLVFITSRMTSNAQLEKVADIGRIAAEEEVLTIAVITEPAPSGRDLTLESRNMHVAKLSESVDVLVVIPEARLKKIGGHDLVENDRSTNTSDLLVYAIRGVSDLLATPGLISIDIDDVCSVLGNRGLVRMGIGMASGENRATEAAHELLSSPLLGGCIPNARGVLINISGGSDLELREVGDVCALIEEAVHEDANIIIGTIVDPDLHRSIRVTALFAGTS